MDTIKIAKFRATMTFPTFYKESEVSAARSIFADLRNSRFPCDSKSATFASTLLFADSLDQYTKDERARILGRIKEAADMWGIGDECAKAVLTLQNKLAAENQTTVDPSHYALVVDGCGYFPVRTQSQVKASSFEFVENRYRLPYALRKQAAQAILKKASDYQLELDSTPKEKLMLSAGFIPATFTTVKEAVDVRCRALRQSKQTKAAQTLSRLTDQFANQQLKEAATSKLVQVLERVDIECGLHNRYGIDVPLPEDQLAAENIYKVAEEYIQYVRVGDAGYCKRADIVHHGLDAIYGHDPQKLDNVRSTELLNALESAQCSVIRL